MAKKIDDLVVKIRFKTDISWSAALKLRLAGGEAVAKHLEKTINNIVPEKTIRKKGMSEDLLCGRDKVSAEIAESLGIKHCRWLQINMHVDEAVTVKAEFFPEINGVRQLLPIFEEYELVKKEDNAKKEDT